MLLKFTFKHKKFISFLLILCTVFSMCSQFLTVFAVDGSGLKDENDATLISSENPQETYFELQAEDVPELIDFNEAKEKGHVLRLREKEPDDNTVIFLNEDNTETMYIFAEPIKYTDVYGEIKDKSRNLSLVDGKYTMRENDVQVYFPTNVSDGISASKGEYTVSMVPIPTLGDTITTNATAALVNNKVTYSDVFGTADILYAPLYSGFKEDIILESYNGVNEFNFFIYTNGLTPIKNENGSVSFFDPDTAESVAEMMQVVCYDANNKFAGGDVVITEIKENDIYALTVIADAAFLADENTAYPVSVDPTVSFNTATAIEDAVVYSGKPAKNYANYNYNNIGYVDSSYKIGELLIKFPTLESGIIGNLESYQINSATLQLYPASGGSGNETIRAYRYNATWDESTITWNGLNFNTPPVLLDTVTVPSNTAVTTFNITQAVKTWADSDLSYISPDCGIFLINTDEADPDKCRDFLSTEYASSHSGIGMPRLEVKYTSRVSVYASFSQGEVQVGETAVISAYANIDGQIHYNNGTLLTFHFYDESTRQITDSLVSPDGSLELGMHTSGRIFAKKAGKAIVVVAYAGDPTISTQVIINVINEKIYINQPSGGEHIFNIENQFEYDIDAYVKRDGTRIYDANGGITYSIEKNRCYGVNLFNNSGTSLFSVNTQGEVTYNVSLPSMLNRPSGELCVRVSSVTDPTYVQYVNVRVVCDDYDIDDSAVLSDSAYIRINYPLASNTQQDENMLPATFAGMLYNLTQAAFTNNAVSIAFNTNFARNSNGAWISSETNCNLFEVIRNTKIAVIQTHGDINGFVVNSVPDANGKRTTVTTEDILSLPQGYFNRCELIVLLFCDGTNMNFSDGTYNNPIEMSVSEAFADRGAKRVVAFRNTASFSDSEYFFQTLTTKLIGERGEGNSLIEYSYLQACTEAAKELENMSQNIDKPTQYTKDGNIEPTVALDGTILHKAVWRTPAGEERLIIIGDGDFDETL